MQWFVPGRRFWKRLAIGLCVLVSLSLIANGVVAWRAERRLQSKIDELRAAGEPTSIAELAPAAIRDKQNAAMVLERITDELDTFGKEHSQFYDSPLGKSMEQREDEGFLPDEQQRAAMQTILDKYPTILPTLAEAAACPDYASRLDFSMPASEFIEDLLPRTTYIRTLTRYVDWKMRLLVAEGKSDEAIRLGIQVLQLARLYDREPMLIHGLVSVAIRGVMLDTINTALRGGPVGADLRMELDAELARQDDRSVFPRVLRSERAYAISAANEQTLRVPKLFSWLMLDFYCGELEMLERAIASSEQPWHIVREQWDEVYEEENSPVQLAGLGEWSPIGEALRAVFYADAQRLALTRSLRIVNALGAYRDRTGAEAERLEQLSLPTEATVDPWSGQPLRLKSNAAGWIVYSVWRNGVDDGGSMNYTQGDWGLTPVGYPVEY